MVLIIKINSVFMIRAWKRKVQIAERELHLRQIDAVHYPETITHPWKYLQNPSSILFYKHYNTSLNRINQQNLNLSFPKLSSKMSINVKI
ncbi:unnamed protein product [Adineta steineri]|uniref:Uncharacterized protein n=1 Tax=Adineta steineri TaxID=433720 RepID=A0A814MTL0_9BILA|nr:unnamed protein product [Adineta steineri]CAF3838374.1 unnamed protein product [Adineta steineri]